MREGSLPVLVELRLNFNNITDGGAFELYNLDQSGEPKAAPSVRLVPAWNSLLLFQVEPGALSTDAQLRDFSSRYYIFHYTYQFEYMLDGTPCQPWNIGEWSLDKRHFNDVHPAYPLPQPPKGANEAGVWLLNAWNEAMAANPNWPLRQPPAGSDAPPLQTLYGRRRLD